jgi:MscS family membrane protein
MILTRASYFFYLILSIFSFASLRANENPLTPVRFYSPNETMRVFINSMNDYRKGVETGDPALIQKINRAIQTLDLQTLSPLLREEKGKESAILLKEVLDRVYLPDYEKIPNFVGEGVPLIMKWTVPDTEIAIVNMAEGSRTGEYLFSSDTVQRVGEYYNKTVHLQYLAGSGQGALYQLPWLERTLPPWSKSEVFGFAIWQWVGLVGAIFVGFFLNLITRLFFRFILGFAKKTDTDWDEKLIINLYKPVGFFVAIGFWFVFLYGSGIDGKPFRFLNFVLKMLLGGAFVYFVYSFSDLLVAFFKKQAIQSKAPLDEQLIPVLTKSVRIFLVILGVLIAIQNLGINVVSLIAGLGIGGLAIALAAKDTAANLFGSAMIFMDKPFKIGEHILIGSVEGTVESIGFRSTRIRTWEDSIVTIPNSVVANANIENLGLRRHRRTNLVFGITYDTSPEKMEAFLEAIKNILFASPLVVKDLINVGFREFGTHSLNVIMHFYLQVDSFAKNLEARQLIFLEVMRAAKALDITFALPTSTIHMETFPGQEPIRKPKEFSKEEYQDKAKEYTVESPNSKIHGAGIYTPAYKIFEKDQNSTII